MLAAGLSNDAIVAAVMHDTAKRHSGLGVLGRVITSLAIKLGLPLTTRMNLYRDHGVNAAAELAALGAPPLAIDYALHHHGERPSTIDPGVWAVLTEADRANAMYTGRWGISSRRG